MQGLPTLDDFHTLEKYYHQAAQATHLTTNTPNGYPQYPEQISCLMNYITSSNWCDKHYQPKETSKILAQIDQANLHQVCSLLTAFARSERFSTGSWQSTLTKQRLEPILKRAKHLTHKKP